MEVQSKQAEKHIPRSAFPNLRGGGFPPYRLGDSAGEGDVVVSGLAGSARALFIAGLWQSLRRPLIVDHSAR